MRIKNKKMYFALASLSLALGVGALQSFAVTKPIYATEEAQVDDVIETDLIKTDTTTWKYLDDNTDPAQGTDSLQSWTQKDFNDSTWGTAAGAFGAKRGELVSFDGFTPTVLLKQYYQDAINTPTFFFRTNITIEGIEDIDSIRGSFYHDDAAAIYINGKLLTSVDMPSTPQANNMYYAGAAKGAPAECAINITGARIKEYFNEGNNTIAIEVHNDRDTSSDLYYEFRELKSYKNEPPVEVQQKSLMLTIGATQTSKNISWYANTDTLGAIQYTKKENVIDGTFPATYQDVKAVSKVSAEAGFNAFQATLANLEGNTQYAYRVVNGETVSPIYYFNTKNLAGSYNFVLMGDPQIGSGGTATDTTNWKATLETTTKTFDPDFILSAGDQVNNAASESEYAGYIQSEFSSFANATSIGNHDSGSSAYGEHFNLPNESTQYGQTTAGSDYYYVYNNTLFMMINSNDRSTAEHKAFMEEAIAANPNVRWKTVVFHHSIYSTASHVNDSDIVTRRNELPPVFEELDIDVVLMGHDHVYTRTYMMDTFTPDTSNGVESKVVNPKGILYLTANSASGSKYYSIKAPDAEFAAKMDQSKRKTLTNIEVSETAYTMTTYFADDLSVLDTFTIEKTSTSNLESLLEDTTALVENEYTKDSWNTLQTAITEAQDIVAFFSKEKQTKVATSFSQSDIDEAALNLKAAVEGLVKIEVEPTSPPIDNTTKPSDTTTSIKTGDTTNTSATWVLLLSALGSIGILLKKKKQQ